VDESQTGEPGWLGGEIKGKTGWFPANYAEKIPESEVPLSLRASAASSSAPKLGSHISSAASSTTATPMQPVSTESASIAPPSSAPAPPGPASSTSSTSSNWADFSTT
ncbi:hypothetical protein M9458_001187, partial [Cirrhinus mrigala]